MLIHECLKGKRIILASASPRRRQLLADAGVVFTVADKYECDECWPDDMSADDVASYLSRLKSKAFPRVPDDDEIVITADTTVNIDGKVLGKPADRDEALSMLSLLSGRTHEVVTGVTLRSGDRMHTFSSRTSVRFRTIADDEMAYYVDTFKPYDKAGAYGIQEWIGYTAVEGIEGSFYNVMGLPVQRVCDELRRFVG